MHAPAPSTARRAAGPGPSAGIGHLQLLAASLALAGAGALASDDLPQALPPEQEAVAITAAETTGRAIFEHDRAAAVATDVAMAERAFKRDRRVRGWVTEARDEGIAVTFIDETPSALYRVMVSPAGKAGPLQALDAPEALSPYEAGASAARATALATPFQPCAKTYNTVVLPVESGAEGAENVEGGWVVYLLPGTTRHDTVPIGGTYRMEVRDGALVSQRAFTRSCISLQRGPDTASMMITHLLDALPTEAHVHWSLWAGTPMYVSTPPAGSLWNIQLGVIRKLEKKGDGEP